MEYDIIEHASTGQLIDFWKHFRAGFKQQGATSPMELTDPEFYFCVVRAALKAKWFTDKKPKEDEIRAMDAGPLEELAAPIWEVYQESSKQMDDDEKNA